MGTEMKLALFVAQAAAPHRMNVEERVMLGRLNMAAESLSVKETASSLRFTLVNFKEGDDPTDRDSIPYTNSYIEHLHVAFEGKTFKGTVMMHALGKGLTAVGFINKKRVFAMWDSKPLNTGQLIQMMPKFFYTKVFNQ